MHPTIFRLRTVKSKTPVIGLRDKRHPYEKENLLSLVNIDMDYMYNIYDRYNLLENTWYESNASASTKGLMLNFMPSDPVRFNSS